MVLDCYANNTSESSSIKVKPDNPSLFRQVLRTIIFEFSEFLIKKVKVFLTRGEQIKF